MVLTVRALKNPVHYMTITLDDIEEVITSKERLNLFIEHMERKNTMRQKRTLVQKSSDLRRNTIVSIAKEKVPERFKHILVVSAAQVISKV